MEEIKQSQVELHPVKLPEGLDIFRNEEFALQDYGNGVYLVQGFGKHHGMGRPHISGEEMAKSIAYLKVQGLDVDKVISWGEEDSAVILTQKSK